MSCRGVGQYIYPSLLSLQLFYTRILDINILNDLTRSAMPYFKSTSAPPTKAQPPGYSETISLAYVGEWSNVTKDTSSYGIG